MKTAIFILCLACCVPGMGQQRISAHLKAHPTRLVLGPKPNPADKNLNGTPAYATYEDYVEALAGWKVREVLASMAHVPAVTIAEQNETPSSNREDLKKQITILESRLSLDESLLANKQDKQTEIILNPANLGVFQRLDSDPLQFLVSLKSVTPYLNGYKVIINVGNPSTAHFSEVKIMCKWSKPYDWTKYSATSYKSWVSALHASETEVQNDILPGSWNPVEVVLLPAKPEELGYLAVSIESSSASLNNN